MSGDESCSGSESPAREPEQEREESSDGRGKPVELKPAEPAQRSGTEPSSHSGRRKEKESRKSRERKEKTKKRSRDGRSRERKERTQRLSMDSRRSRERAEKKKGSRERKRRRSEDRSGAKPEKREKRPRKSQERRRERSKALAPRRAPRSESESVPSVLEVKADQRRPASPTDPPRRKKCEFCWKMVAATPSGYEQHKWSSENCLQWQAYLAQPEEKKNWPAAIKAAHAVKKARDSEMHPEERPTVLRLSGGGKGQKGSKSSKPSAPSKPALENKPAKDPKTKAPKDPPQASKPRASGSAQGSKSKRNPHPGADPKSGSTPTVRIQKCMVGSRIDGRIQICKKTHVVAVTSSVRGHCTETLRDGA